MAGAEANKSLALTIAGELSNQMGKVTAKTLGTAAELTTITHSIRPEIPEVNIEGLRQDYLHAQSTDALMPLITQDAQVLHGTSWFTGLAGLPISELHPRILAFKLFLEKMRLEEGRDPVSWKRFIDALSGSSDEDVMSVIRAAGTQYSTDRQLLELNRKLDASPHAPEMSTRTVLVMPPFRVAAGLALHFVNGMVATHTVHEDLLGGLMSHEMRGDGMMDLAKQISVDFAQAENERIARQAEIDNLMSRLSKFDPTAIGEGDRAIRTMEEMADIQEQLNKAMKAHTQAALIVAERPLQMGTLAAGWQGFEAVRGSYLLSLSELKALYHVQAAAASWSVGSMGRLAALGIAYKARRARQQVLRTRGNADDFLKEQIRQIIQDGDQLLGDSRRIVEQLPDTASSPQPPIVIDQPNKE